MKGRKEASGEALYWEPGGQAEAGEGGISHWVMLKRSGFLLSTRRNIVYVYDQG